MASPTLARLAELGQESARRFDAIKFLLPETIRSSVKPGPIENSVWCLVVENAAAASKLRQLLPNILAQLSAQGQQVSAIRIRVAGSR